MTTEEFIIQTSDRLLDVLLEHRATHPGFTFWLRTKDSSRSDAQRLERGYWFQGSDYIFLGFYRPGDWKNKTRTFGFVIGGDPSNPTIYIEWVYNDPLKRDFDAKEIEFYKRLEKLFPNPKQGHGQKFQYHLGRGGDVIERFKKFLNDDKPKIDQLIIELGLESKFFIPEDKFEKRLAKTLDLRVRLRRGEIPTATLEQGETTNDASIRRYWLIAPGERARLWEEFHKNSIIGIGWDDLGDLTEFDSRQEIQSAMQSLYKDTDSTQSNNSLALWEFVAVMKPGDIIIPKRGVGEYLGYGVVTGDYQFNDDREEYNHIRTVDWKKEGVWPDDVQRIVMKTLTDITKYPDYVDRLRRLIGIEQDAVIPDKVNYWWINANPSTWRITDFSVGQEQQYNTYNNKGNKKSRYEYFQQVKPGDLFLGYASSPIKKVLAIYEATRSLYINEDSGEEEISFVIVKFLPEPVSIDTIVEMPQYQNSEVKNNRQGSLFKLTKEQYLAVINFDVRTEESVDAYSKENALQALFLDDKQFDEILGVLKYKKNIVLQGPPGTGKTFMAKSLCYTMMGERDNARIEMIQFHQSYSYEDFIQGYRPRDDGGFHIESGVFYRFCKRALADPNREYFFIIDEINRGNLSKIFGELMLLLEADKRSSDYAVSLTYSRGLQDKFHIPPNLYLIGTMNTADRSLSIVDYALRRRFAFININPSFGSKFIEYLTNNGVATAITTRICSKLNALNNIISDTLGDGFLVGHSYFCNVEDGATESWYQRIIKMEIAPLLNEYWFDNKDIANREIESLLS